MKQFDPIAFDYHACRAQLDEFHTLLAAKTELAERGDVLPFFRDRRQLALLLGMFNIKIKRADRIAYEFDLFGDFACDLVVGEWASGSYCFIEFEDATENSVFEQKGVKATREWSRRFDHGFSQIVDWCHKLHGLDRSPDFETRFGRHTINFEAVLVVGRDQHLRAGEPGRLEWRTSYVTVNSKKVTCLTFDQLEAQLAVRLNSLFIMSSANPGAPPPTPPTGP